MPKPIDDVWAVVLRETTADTMGLNVAPAAARKMNDR